MSALPLLVVAFVLVSAGAAQETIPVATLTKIKASTAFVKAKTGPIETSGSGFVIRVDGDTAYVATNHHVVNPRVRVRGSKPVLTLVFDSGTKSERVAQGELVASDP
jgi:S1-C subfamily serine protease